MKNKKLNILGLFKNEFMFIFIILLLAGIYGAGLLVNSLWINAYIKDTSSQSLIVFFIGVGATVVTIIGACFVYAIISAIIHLTQSLIYRIRLAKEISKHYISEDTIRNANYKSIEACLEDIIPMFCRKPFYMENIQKEVKTEDAYVYINVNKNDWVIHECNYLNNVLVIVDNVFSTTKRKITTHYDACSVGYKVKTLEYGKYEKTQEVSIQTNEIMEGVKTPFHKYKNS